MKLLQDLVCPAHYKVNNGTSFTSKVTQGILKALGITYYLHYAWGLSLQEKYEESTNS